MSSGLRKPGGHPLPPPLPRGGWTLPLTPSRGSPTLKRSLGVTVRTFDFPGGKSKLLAGSALAMGLDPPPLGGKGGPLPEERPREGSMNRNENGTALHDVTIRKKGKKEKKKERKNPEKKNILKILTELTGVARDIKLGGGGWAPEAKKKDNPPRMGLKDARHVVRRFHRWTQIREKITHPLICAHPQKKTTPPPPPKGFLYMVPVGMGVAES